MVVFFENLKIICYLDVMNLFVICHLDVNVTTNELIVVEFMCIFLLKDKAIDKSTWVVDTWYETSKIQCYDSKAMPMMCICDFVSSTKCINCLLDHVMSSGSGPFKRNKWYNGLFSFSCLLKLRFGWGLFSVWVSINFEYKPNHVFSILKNY